VESASAGVDSALENGAGYRKIEKHPRSNRAARPTVRRCTKLKLNKNDEIVVAALKANKELTLAELTEKTGVPSKKVFKSLKKLFEHEMIDSMGRKYRLLTETPPASKGKSAAADDEEASDEE
jgi:uncharacterized membrane protein